MTAHSSPLRALFLDFNLRYMNPTRNNLVRLFSEAFELTCFGPGYTSEPSLSRGVDRFIDENGPFDIIFATEHIVFWGDHLSAAGYRRCYATDFPLSLIEEGKNIQSFFFEYSGAKMSVLLESDFYNFQVEQIAILERCGGHVAGWGAEVVPPVECVKSTDHRMLKQATNHWRDFAVANPRRIVSTLHFVAPEEISDFPLNQRRRDWSVLGAPYPARTGARLALHDAGISCAWRRQAWTVRVCSRLFQFPFFSADFLIRSMQKPFSEALVNSKFGYTCGSPVAAPIRKFFEIPAAGGVLVCLPFFGARDCGFVDGHNFIYCEPRDLPDVHKYLSHNPHEAQRIANAGRRLITKKHSLATRARQLAKASAAIVANEFEGASWNGGDWLLFTSRDGARFGK